MRPSHARLYKIWCSISYIYARDFVRSDWRSKNCHRPSIIVGVIVARRGRPLAVLRPNRPPLHNEFRRRESDINAVYSYSVECGGAKVFLGNQPSSH